MISTGRWANTQDLDFKMAVVVQCIDLFQVGSCHGITKWHDSRPPCLQATDRQELSNCMEEDLWQVHFVSARWIVMPDEANIGILDLMEYSSNDGRGRWWVSEHVGRDLRRRWTRQAESFSLCWWRIQHAWLDKLNCVCWFVWCPNSGCSLDSEDKSSGL